MNFLIITHVLLGVVGLIVGALLIAGKEKDHDDLQQEADTNQ